MTTNGDALRSEAWGWSCEDGNLVLEAHREFAKTYAYNQLPVGFIGGTKDGFHCHPTPLHALGEGWKLLAPPIEETYELENGTKKCYVWWFTKD